MWEWLDFTDEVVSVDSKGKEIKREKMTNYGYKHFLSKKTFLEMISIPSGQYLIGAPKSELGWKSSQSPQSLINVEAFCLSRYPITQRQWREVAKLEVVNIELNPYPAHFEGYDRPVEQINWWEAVEFCDRLSRATGLNYRLPTEKEWEYACRGGTNTPFHFGQTISTDLANYSGVDWDYGGKVCSYGRYGEGSWGCDRRETSPVGMLGVANAFGLYDLHGNVREWCADYWRDNYEAATIEDRDRRVLRGGSWNDSPNKCRSAYRVKFLANASLYDIGFRVLSDNSP